MFKELFDYLNKSFSITSKMLVPYATYDDSGKAKSFTLFIPWNLVTEHNIAIDNIVALLPEGWNARPSSKLEHQQEAIEKGVTYVPSIAISEMTDSADMLNDYIAGKLSKK